MAVVTREDVQSLREDVQALTAAQAQDRTEVQALRVEVAKLDGQVGEYDKRLATKEDVEKAIGAVRSDIQSVQIEQAGVKASLRWITWLLSIGFSAVIALGVAVLVQLLRMAGG